MTFAKAHETLESFYKLKEGWDSYGGKPISHRAIDWAKVLLLRLGQGGGWTPVPCSNGGIQLEFHEQGVDIEIMIDESSESGKTL
jgi:hypothetical protein